MQTSVTIHSSQYPATVRSDLLESLRSRQVNHKFHYDGIKQTQKWLALHRAYSPSRSDANCAALYDQCFAAAASHVGAKPVEVLGLGCGGGQKDSRLLKALRSSSRKLSYTPVDASAAMVLVAAQTAIEAVGDVHSAPFVCDLAHPEAWAALSSHSARARIITFFGMIPGFDPGYVLPRISGLLGPDDVLLFSANLAPGADYTKSVERMVSNYDNAPTRDWLLAFLADLGVASEDGEIKFSIEGASEENKLKRITARYIFQRARTIQVDDAEVNFQPGESMRLFFSYRYTPPLVKSLLARHGMETHQAWITGSGEEGIFLVMRAGSKPQA